jgi:hypothetical protein
MMIMHAKMSQILSKSPSSATTRSLKERIQPCRILEIAASTVSALIARTCGAFRSQYSRALKYIDPFNNSTPRASTVIWSTVCFVAFLFSGGFAVGYPSPWMRIMVLVFNSLIFVLLAILGASDIRYHRKHSKLNKKLN